MRINTKSSEQTQEVGKILGEEILASALEEPIVIALAGDLGAGKTTFVKGLAKGLGIETTVVSPTFILIGSYQSNPGLKTSAQGGPALGGKNLKLKTLYHLDPYRLADASSLVPELDELLQIPQAVIAIEWAERLKQYIPKQAIHIALEHTNNDERNITISFLE